MARLHAVLVRPVVEAVVRILAHREHAPAVVESLLREHPRWGSRDRRFVANTIYELIRWWRWCAHLAGIPAADAIPPTGATPRHVELAWAAHQWTITGEVPELPGLAKPGPGACPAHAMEAVPRAIRASIPDWLDELGDAQLGAAWPDLLIALNQPADVFLRTNRLRTDPDALRTALLDEGIPTEPVPGFPDALRLAQRSRLTDTRAYREGLFEVQDAGSQCIAPLLRPAPGCRILDACAGAGGKTLHLAALTGDRSTLLALDTVPARLQALLERARRQRVQSIRTRVVQPGCPPADLIGWADAILLDVPCSGLGVLRRDPGAKWRLSPATIQTIQQEQAQILDQYRRFLRPGGVLVYATCSVLPSENQRIIQAFLGSPGGTGWSIEETLHLLPGSTSPGDGYFACRLRAP